MNNAIRHIITGIASVMLAAAMILAFTAGVSSRRTILCKDIEINIIDSLQNSFVTKADIKGFIDKEYGNYIGQPVDSIDLVRIEDIVDGRSAVRKSEAYVTKDGIIHIDVTQRNPVVRFQKTDGGFYADSEGYIFPLQRNYASHVQVIDGYIPLAANSGYKGAIEDPQEMEWFKKMMNVVNHMEKSRIWKDKIVQISVDKGGDIILVPREGNELFVFGQPVEVADKFRKMEKYYTHILPAKGEGHYKRIDLRFKGQIVCR